MKKLAIAVATIFSLQAFAAVPVPMQGETPVDVAKIRVDNPAVLPTGGTWRFALDHGAMVAGKFKKQFASASSSQLSPDHAIDGDASTRWCASGGEFPQWWQVDLGKAETIHGVNIAWEFPDGKYKFKIDGSIDGEHWTEIKSDADKARYIKVTISDAIDASGEPRWASFYEVKINVDRDGKVVEWKPADTVGDDSFANVNFDDSKWNDIPVPSNWEVLGYSIPTYFGPDDSVGLYRRVMDIPASFTGKNILWHFDGVTDAAEIFVNGKRAAYHEGGFTAFDVDLTTFIKPGEKNLLAVRVFKTTPTTDLDTGDYWLLGGIHRESYLLALPQAHVDDVTVTTPLDEKYTSATLKVDISVRAKAGESVSAVGTLYSFDGTKIDVPALAATGTADDKGSVHLKIEQPVKSPKLWSAEKPNLYYLVTSLKQGDTTIETFQQRFGFRQVDIKGDTLLWNGVPIKCTGTCRHEEWSAVGHALTEEMWQTDVAMMKAANINAVRTSHYNHAQRFLELCEEKGIYILDEIPACWVKPRDLTLKDAFVQHAAETLARDKNLACVLAWSCGNESGWGPDFKAMIDYCAATDPTRPRFVSEVSKSTDPVLSFNDHHYPQDRSLAEYAAQVGKGPHLVTEGPHTFYNSGAQAYDFSQHDLWGECLAATWNRVWPSQDIFGAFIWEWQDQGLADKFPDKTNIAANGLRMENYKGIVTGYRKIKPEIQHVKMVYSPVTIDAREVNADGKEFAVDVQNRYSFTDLSELKCNWQALASDKELAKGEVKIDCAPRQSTTAKFPMTDGMDALRISFVHPDGREIYSTKLHVGGSPLPTPPAAIASAGDLKFTDAGPVGAYIFAATGGSIMVDRSTGKLSILHGEGKPVLVGPILNLGEARVDDGDFLEKRDAAWIGSKSAPILSNAKVTASLVNGNAGHIAVTADVSMAESAQVVAKLTYTLDIHPDLKMDFKYQLHWTSPDRQAWELGVKFIAPKSADTLSWLRDSQWTDYPADHIGAPSGSVKSDSVSFASTKRNIIWASLGEINLIAQNSPLHVRAKSDGDNITLFASTLVASQRSFSSGYLDQYRIRFRQGQTYGSAFQIQLHD